MGINLDARYNEIKAKKKELEKLEEKIRLTRNNLIDFQHSLVRDELEVMKEYQILAKEKDLPPVLLYYYFQGFRRVAALTSSDNVVVSKYNDSLVNKINFRSALDRKKLLVYLNNYSILTDMSPGTVLCCLNSHDNENAIFHLRGIRRNLGHYVNREKFHF